MAILAADVVGYPRLMGADEAGTLAALKQHGRLFRSGGRAHNGHIVKLIGGGTIVEFGSVIDAMNSALSVQRSAALRRMKSCASRRSYCGSESISGDVIIEGDDIYGDGVNIAARLEPLAEPGGICVSSIVNENIGNKSTSVSEDGDITVKNINRPIQFLEMASGRDPDVTRSKMDERLPKSRRRRSPFSVHQHVGRPGTGVFLRRHKR